jgi:hypothetical protein
MSTPLDRSSVVFFCAVCIEAGRATEATYQTRDELFGCDQHIRELEQHGRAAIGRQRAAFARQLDAETCAAPPVRARAGRSEVRVAAGSA